MKWIETYWNELKLQGYKLNFLTPAGERFRGEHCCPWQAPAHGWLVQQPNSWWRPSGDNGTCWDLGCELERLWESSRHLKFSNLFPGNIGNTWKILKRLAITKVSCLRKMICGAGWDNICIRCYSRLYWQTRWAPIIEAMSWSTSWQTNTLVKSVVTQLSLFLKVFGSISKRCAASTAILMVLCRCHDLGGEHEVAESGPEALNGKDRLGNIHCKIHWNSRNYDDGNDSKCRNSEQNKCW